MNVASGLTSGLQALPSLLPGKQEPYKALQSWVFGQGHGCWNTVWCSGCSEATWVGSSAGSHWAISIETQRASTQRDGREQRTHCRPTGGIVCMLWTHRTAREVLHNDFI